MSFAQLFAPLLLVLAAAGLSGCAMTPFRVAGSEAAVEAAKADSAGMLPRSEEHTSELQSLMRISYAVFCLKKKKQVMYKVKKSSGTIPCRQTHYREINGKRTRTMR